MSKDLNEVWLNMVSFVMDTILICNRQNDHVLKKKNLVYDRKLSNICIVNMTGKLTFVVERQLTVRLS